MQQHLKVYAAPLVHICAPVYIFSFIHATFENIQPVIGLIFEPNYLINVFSSLIIVPTISMLMDYPLFIKTQKMYFVTSIEFVFGCNPKAQ